MATNCDPILVVENVRKRFDSGLVLDRVGFTVGQNQFTVVLGPNGCGKTTLVRLIAGVTTPDEGKIRLGCANTDATRAIVFQKPLLLPWLTVEENILLPLKLSKSSSNSFCQRLEELLDLAKLKDIREQYPTKLSGGQRQKIALMRALITKPRLLVMDEPFSNLDDQTREELQEYLTDLQASERLAILFVTHDLFEACMLADQIVVLSRKPASVVRQINLTTEKAKRRGGEDLDQQVLQIRQCLRERIACVK